MPPAQQDLRAAEAQAQNSSGMEPFAEQGGQSMGRPGMPEQAKEESRSPRVVNPTAAAQPHQPSTAEPAARALQSSPAGDCMLHPYQSLPSSPASTEKMHLQRCVELGVSA